MRVFGKLSFSILIACLAFFVNKQADAGKGSTSQSKGEENETKNSQSNQPKTIIGGNPSDDISDTEGVEYFNSFLTTQACVKSSGITEIRFEQKLDHFNHSDRTTWIQRAYLDTVYEQEDGPVLLRVEQFRSIRPEQLENRKMAYLGRRLHATLYVLEHRYFGKSVPTNDFSTENLVRFCTIEQVLADIAHFIKSSDHASKKWIVFGEGYGGNLAAWFRLKYPHIASSALVFEAPINTMTKDKETFGVFNQLPDSMKAKLQSDFNAITMLITNAKYLDLMKSYKMCTQLDEGGNIDDNVNLMYLLILHALRNSYDVDRKMWDKSRETTLSISDIVVIAMRTYSDCLLVNYSNAIEKYKNKDKKNTDELNYPTFLKRVLGTRPQLFLQCTQYGLFKTYGEESNEIGVKINLDIYHKFCEDAFNIKFNLNVYSNAIDTTIMSYGGRNIAATHVIFMHRDDLYWEKMGMVKSEKNELIVIDYKDMMSMKSGYKLIIDKLYEWTKN